MQDNLPVVKSSTNKVDLLNKRNILNCTSCIVEIYKSSTNKIQNNNFERELEVKLPMKGDLSNNIQSLQGPMQ